MRIKKRCDKCGRLFNSLKKLNGKLVCYFCYIKISSLVPNKYMKLDEALDKVYSVHSSITKSGHGHCTICVPPCFYGKKVKLVVVD